MNEEHTISLKELGEVKTVRVYNQAYVDKQQKRIAELEKENDLAKSLLYCAKGTCDNCGFVNCENFQMQRKSEPCALYISYQDRIKHLEKENADLKKGLSVVNASNSFNKEQLTKAKEIISKFLNAKSIEETCVAESEAEQFLKVVSE